MEDICLSTFGGYELPLSGTALGNSVNEINADRISASDTGHWEGGEKLSTTKLSLMLNDMQVWWL